MTSHDHNFKNVFLDFPKDALAWLLPDALMCYGPLKHIEFVRQEPKKRRLAESHFALDMPILFSFESGQVLLWLVEFQEDKNRFSIHTLLQYTSALMKQYPKTVVIPTVLFTDRTKWVKDVKRELNTLWGNRVLLHFEYIHIRLFDCHARDYYDYPNPVVKILLPKMNYAPEERYEVIRQAYVGLFHLTAPTLFDKYVDFIDAYSDIREDEKETLHRELIEKEDTVMLAQYIRDKGFQDGRLEGKCTVIERQLIRRFGELPDWAKEQLAHATSEQLDRWAERILEAHSIQSVMAE